METSIKLLRLFQDRGATIGVLLDPTGAFLAFTLEDLKRAGEKVPGETRIPAGTYKIRLRTAGEMHKRYASLFPTIHRGMLELQDVPNFTAILIHIGNTAADTKGCVLVGNGVTTSGGAPRLTDSTAAYRRIYPELAAAVKGGLTITVKDEGDA